MIINRELKHLHVHVPKNGGSSFRSMLTEHNWNKESDKLDGLGAHSSLNTIERDPFLLNELGDFYKTVMIRNPWEHAVSYYRHALHRGNFLYENFFEVKNFRNMTEEEKYNIDNSFERFIKTGYKSRCQSTFLYESDRLKFDEWFDYKNYGDMLKYFSDKFNIILNKDLVMKHRRELDYVIDMDYNKPYQEFYNDETYNIVKNLSTKEIKIFDYKF